MNSRCGPKLTITFFAPRYWFTWAGLGLSFLVSLLPLKVRHFFGNKLGSFLYKKNNNRRKIIKANLALCYPEKPVWEIDDMAYKHMQWHACALVDYSLFFFASKKRLVKTIEIRGKQHIDTAIQKNQSIMILLAHSVMLEFAPAALGMYYDCYGSYKSSKNPVIDWMVARSRCRHVKFVVSRDEGMRKLVKSLVPKRLLIFLPDEDLGLKNSVFAPFFDIPKATLTTPARISAIGKAVSLPAFTWFDKDSNKFILQIGEPLNQSESAYPGKDEVNNAAVMNKSLEALIRIQAEQYMWTLKWFRTRPEDEKPIY